MSAFSANIGTDQYSPINSELRKNTAKKSVDSCSVSPYQYGIMFQNV